jgi:small subunit ribosomal protein S15
MLKPNKKTKIIGLHKLHETDTGSPEVQVTVLSERISEVSQHLKSHQKDASSRRGLLRMIIRRKRLLNWLKTNAPKRFQKLSQSLKLD